MTQYDEKMTQLNEKMTQHDEKMAQLNEKMTQNHEKVTQHDEKMTQLDEKMTQLNEMMTEKVTQSDDTHSMNISSTHVTASCRVTFSICDWKMREINVKLSAILANTTPPVAQRT